VRRLFPDALRVAHGLVAGGPGLIAGLFPGLIPGLAVLVARGPGQSLAQAPYRVPDVFPDLADDVVDVRRQLRLEPVEFGAAPAQFLAAGLGDPSDFAAVRLVVVY